MCKGTSREVWELPPFQSPGSNAHARLLCPQPRVSPLQIPLVSAKVVALACRDGGPAVSNTQGRSRQGGNCASVSCPRPYLQKTPPVFVILKLLGKILLSKVLTSVSVLLFLFLPRKEEGLWVDRTSLLPNRRQGR